MPPPQAAGQDTKKSAAEMQAANDQLTEELETTKLELDATMEKLNTVVARLVEAADQRWKKQHNAMSEDFDPLQLDNDMITELVGKFLAKHKEREESVEQRVEQLECQVTEMSFDLIRMKSKCHAYEAGLKQLSHVKEINAMKDQVYQLQVIAGEAYHSCEAKDIMADRESLFAVDGITDRADCEASYDFDNANKLNLIPPAQKFSGDTPLRNLLPDLRLYIVKEFSIPRPLGAHWVTLAQRVGLPQAAIDEWSAEKLLNPAGHVLDAWIEACPSVTVRLLHRHLMSPAMRCTIVAKRLSDFYDVS